MVDTNNDNTTQPLTFAEHLDRLPHQPGDRLAISWEPPGRGMKTRVVDLADAQAEVDKHITTANVWYRVNPTTLPAGTIGRRGRNCETARQVAVYADLDVKPGGCEDIEQAEQIITAVKHIVGTWPVTIVYTGHGVQPYWALESEIEIPNNALSKAFGRLVAAVADKEFGVTVDTVSDLARMLRVPGSVNFKDSEGRQLVKAAADIGGPLTPEELIERMAEVGIELSDDDDDDVGEAISPPEDWIFYPDTDCGYVAKMVAGWATDVVPKRHTWFLSQSIRIEAAHRWGRLHDQAHKDAVKAVLENEFRRRLAGEPGRPKRLEISDIRREAVKRVAAKTNEQVHAELGWHDHNAKAAAPPKAGEAKPKLWDAGDLSPIRQARFLAKNRIPKAAVTILCGDEGIGKSLFWVYIAAAVTTGKPLPEFGIPPREPANNILVLTEDNWQEDVLPRLTVVKADLSRIKVICTDPDGTGSPIFPDSMELITNAEPRPPVVVIDAWLDTVPGNLSVKDTQQARAALAPWKDAATRTGAAIILLTHPNRLSTGNMRDKYGATMALRQKARMTLYALQDPKRRHADPRTRQGQQRARWHEGVELQNHLGAVFRPDTRSRWHGAVTDLRRRHRQDGEAASVGGGRRRAA